MKKDLLFILIGLVLFIGIRIYKKYAQKGDAKQGVEKKQDSRFSSASKDDDYEPYSKK